MHGDCKRPLLCFMYKSWRKESERRSERSISGLWSDRDAMISRFLGAFCTPGVDYLSHFCITVSLFHTHTCLSKRTCRLQRCYFRGSLLKILFRFISLFSPFVELKRVGPCSLLEIILLYLLLTHDVPIERPSCSFGV